MDNKLEFKFGNTSNMEPFWAKEELVTSIHHNVDVELRRDVIEGFRKGLKREITRNRNVKMAIDTCVHCGACLNACPTYIATGDISNSPVGRADLVRGVLKSERTTGKIFGSLVGARKLDEAYLDKIATYYYQCLECRRCGEICPFGIDQADVTRTVRSVLHDVGKISRYTATVISNAEKTGNNMGLPAPALKSTIDFVKDEIKEEKGIDVFFKVDEKAHAMFVPPSADFFSNLETLKGYMLFLHAIGMDYSFTTEHAELANFGLFTDTKHLKVIGDHLVSVARKLDVKVVVAGECGHGWRAFKNYVIPKLREQGIEGVHIFYLVEEAMKTGKLKLNPENNGDSIYVYQDPCNYARGGDLIEEPRYILQRVVGTYRDSPHSRERTWCCGGGGGVLTDELLPLRIEYAKLWYEDALSIDGDQVIRPCAICKAQLSHTMPKLNKMNSGNLTNAGLMDLVYKALTV